MPNVIILPLPGTEFGRNRRTSAFAQVQALKREQERLEEELRQLRAAVQLYTETIRRLRAVAVPLAEAHAHSSLYRNVVDSSTEPSGARA